MADAMGMSKDEAQAAAQIRSISATALSVINAQPSLFVDVDAASASEHRLDVTPPASQTSFKAMKADATHEQSKRRPQRIM